jgi:hypothetical protein
MTSEAIQKQLETKVSGEKLVNIHFKQRNMVTGLFIRENDFSSLQSKNLWRIVTTLHIDEWRKTKNISLCRIFNGTDFTKLSEAE